MLKNMLKNEAFVKDMIPEFGGENDMCAMCPEACEFRKPFGIK